MPSQIVIRLDQDVARAHTPGLAEEVLETMFKGLLAHGGPARELVESYAMSAASCFLSASSDALHFTFEDWPGHSLSQHAVGHWIRMLAATDGPWQDVLARAGTTMVREPLWELFFQGSELPMVHFDGVLVAVRAAPIGFLCNSATPLHFDDLDPLQKRRVAEISRSRWCRCGVCAWLADTHDEARLRWHAERDRPPEPVEVRLASLRARSAEPDHWAPPVDVSAQEAAAYLCEVADTLADARQSKTSIPLLEQAISLEESAGEAPEALANTWGRLATALARIGQVDESLVAFERHKLLAGDRPPLSVRLSMGDLLLHFKRFQAVIEEMEQTRGLALEALTICRAATNEAHAAVCILESYALDRKRAENQDALISRIEAVAPLAIETATQRWDEDRLDLATFCLAVAQGLGGQWKRADQTFATRFEDNRNHRSAWPDLFQRWALLMWNRRSAAKSAVVFSQIVEMSAPLPVHKGIAWAYMALYDAVKPPHDLVWGFATAALDLLSAGAGLRRSLWAALLRCGPAGQVLGFAIQRDDPMGVAHAVARGASAQTRIMSMEARDYALRYGKQCAAEALGEAGSNGPVEQPSTGVIAGRRWHTSWHGEALHAVLHAESDAVVVQRTGELRCHRGESSTLLAMQWYLTPVDVRADGKLLALATDGALFVSEGDPSHLVYTPPEGERPLRAWWMAWGDQIAMITETDDATTIICRVLDLVGRCRARRAFSSEGVLMGAGPCRGGHHIMLADESAVHIWDPAGDVVSCRVVSWLLCRAVSAVAITHSAELLAWSSQDGVVLQQAGAPEPCARWSLPVLEPLLVNALRASSPADRVGRWRGVDLFAWHGCPTLLDEQPELVPGMATPPTALAFSPDGRILAAATCGVVWIRPVDASEAPVVLAAVGDGPVSLEWSTDGRSLLVSGGEWRQAVLLRVRTSAQ